MITIEGNTETEIVIKKSKFLGLACPVSSEQDAQDILDKRRKEHYNATHHCFAYILENGTIRYSDDGEPQGTAGLPMLEVIKKEGLSDVVVVCTRYFGGTQLGANGLVRAYTRSTADTLHAAHKVMLVPCSIFACTFSYNTWSKTEKTLLGAGYLLDDIQYLDKIFAKICVTGGNEDAFLQQIASLSLGQTIPEPMGTKLVRHEL